MPRVLWFIITLIDCNGQNLAMWNYDSTFPVIPPRFTYVNNDERCRYMIRFHHTVVHQELLSAGIDINLAIDAAIRKFVKNLEGKMHK